MPEINLSKLEENLNTGLLIVDMQEYFFRLIHDKNKEEEIEKYQKIILEKAIKNKWPICITETNNQDDSMPIYKKIKSKFSNSDLFLSCLKSQNSAFSNELVIRFFKNNSVKNLIIMGLNASLCVKDTTKDAIRYNFNVFTSSRIIADYGSLNKNLSWSFYSQNTTMILFD